MGGDEGREIRGGGVPDPGALGLGAVAEAGADDPRLDPARLAAGGRRDQGLGEAREDGVASRGPT